MTTVLSILLALLVFGILIFVHELGHFLVARACKVTVNEFSIGMGPKLFSWRGKKLKSSGSETESEVPQGGQSGEHLKTDSGTEGTLYSLRLLPIGGYVSMDGENEASDNPSAFYNKNVWQRIAITVAGAVMNILLGFLATLLLVGLTGNFLNTTVNGFLRDDPNVPAVSEEFLQVGDKILSVNGIKMHNYTEIANEIMYNGYKPVDLVVLRNGEKISINGAQFSVITEGSISYGDVDFATQNEGRTPITLLKNGFYSTVSQIRMLWDSLIDIFTGRFGMDAVSGPVGVVEAIGESAQRGFLYVLSLFSFITLNLGVFNLLPIPALDGGRLLFLLIEAIRRKRLNAQTEAMIHGIGMLILLALMAIITLKDVINLF